MHDLTDELMLSAYVDGEVPSELVPQLERETASNEKLKATIGRMRQLSELLHQTDVPDIAERKSRSLASIRSRIAVRSTGSLWARWRQIQLPLPAVAAAALIVAALVTAVVWSAVPRQQVTASDLLAQGNEVDVTIRVDDADMEQVLQWLVDKEMLGEISIQLPEQQWSIVGDPVLLKPDDYPEGFAE